MSGVHLVMTGAQCRVARELLGLPKKALAEQAGVDRVRLTRFENGTDTTSFPVRAKIRAALEAAVIEFTSDGSGETQAGGSAMTQSFAAAIQETVEYVERALARIETGDGVEAEVHNVRAYLVNTLEMIDRDPGIEAAADDLYATAAAFVAGQGRPEDGSPRRDKRVLREAFLRLRDKLASARPSNKAQGMGLE